MSAILSRYAVCQLLATALFVPMCCVVGRSVNPRKTQAATGQPCPVFHFYDTGTDQCESCASLHCDHADHWNTEQQCQSLCQDYVRSLQCRQDQYYDVQTGHCSPCQELCLLHRLKETTRQCHTLCPDFHPKRGADTTASTTAHPDVTTPGGGEDPQVQDKPSTESNALIWIIPPSLLLILSTGAVGLLCLAVRRIRCRPQERKGRGTSLTSTVTADPIPEENELLRHPVVETQPGVNSELVPNGT